MIETDPRRTALYRFFNADGELLYVGVTVNPKARFYGHARDKQWWSEVAAKEIEWIDGRWAAERAESEAINRERPKYNQHPTFWPKPAASTELDPDEDGIDFLEWARRTAHAKGYRFKERGALTGLARAGGGEVGTMRKFFYPTGKGRTDCWGVPLPPALPILRTLAKAFGMNLSDVMVRAGAAEPEDFTRA